MYLETLHKIWVGILIQIVSPEKRSMSTCKYRIGIALIDTITFNRFILLGNEGFVLGLQPLQSFFKCHMLIILDFSTRFARSK